MKSGAMSACQLPRHPDTSGSADDSHWMRLALEQAQLAAQAGEVPVGAVVVKEGRLLATGRNAPISGRDPTAHAEIVALRAAAQILGNYRLDGCTLYVTLEPCAMCGGAMLHARLNRVVYGAADAKTGAAGGALNLFAQPGLNHHTTVVGGVLAGECGSVLQAFFRPRRLNTEPLREDALRTPAQRFAALHPPWKTHSVTDLPALDGLRLTWGEAGPAQAKVTLVGLHGNPGWGWQYAALVPPWVSLGARVLVPDLIGFGLSDKPKKDTFHALAWHHRVLLQWLDRLDLQSVVLVLPSNADPLPHALGQTLPMALGPRCQGVVRCPLPALAPGALAAPHPDRGHNAGPRAWSPAEPAPKALRDASSVALLAQAKAWWSAKGAVMPSADATGHIAALFPVGPGDPVTVGYLPA
jgi:tRNA(adenine34) deaminase